MPMKLPKPRVPRWIRQISWRTVAGAVLLAGIVHISATLAVPLLGPGNAFRKLRDTLPVNQMVFLPPPTPGNQLLPFVAADALYAACRFDVSATGVTVSALLADPGWTLSLHTPQGDNFYVMPAQQLRRSEVTFVIVPAGDKVLDFGASTRRPTGDETQVDSPVNEGLVLVRAPLRGLSWRAETEARLRRASCAPLPQRR
jgi:uncharacterized membrane protein